MMQSVRDELGGVFTEVARELVEITPELLSALLLIVVGLGAAKLVEVGLRFALRRRGVQRIVHRVEADAWLHRLGTRRSITELVPRLVFWILVLLFARAAADALALPAISQALGSLVGFVPELLAAGLVLIVGGFVARLAGGAAEAGARGVGIDYARGLGRIVTVALLAVAVVMAAAQLGIDTAMIHLTAGAVLLAFALAFGLAFGLGAREVTRSIIAGHYARKTLPVGSRLRVGGVEGTLVGITPTHLLVERDGRVTSLANAVLMQQAVERADGSM